jgi:hypothetical protein
MTLPRFHHFLDGPLLFAVVTVCLAGQKANDVLTVTSVPDGATVEWNRKVIGVTPLTYRVGEYAFNVRKSTLYSKRLSQPVILRVSKEGYISKDIVITHSWVWRSFNGRVAYTYFTISSNDFQVDLDKVAAVHAAMTNGDIIRLKVEGIGDELVIDKISNNPAAYNLELDDLVKLHAAGISDAIIQAMLHAK